MPPENVTIREYTGWSMPVEIFEILAFIAKELLNQWLTGNLPQILQEVRYNLHILSSHVQLRAKYIIQTRSSELLYFSWLHKDQPSEKMLKSHLNQSCALCIIVIPYYMSNIIKLWKDQAHQMTCFNETHPNVLYHKINLLPSTMIFEVLYVDFSRLYAHKSMDPEKRRIRYVHT